MSNPFNVDYKPDSKLNDINLELVKVLLEKVDTLKDVADSLTKYVTTKKFSWCRETMGIASLDC
jgi:hypothetical protein